MPTSSPRDARGPLATRPGANRGAVTRTSVTTMVDSHTRVILGCHSAVRAARLASSLVVVVVVAVGPVGVGLDRKSV